MASKVFGLLRSFWRHWSWCLQAHTFFRTTEQDRPFAKHYFVQQLYRGLSHFGIVLIGAIVANPALAISMRNRRTRLLVRVCLARCGGGDAGDLFCLDLPGKPGHE